MNESYLVIKEIQSRLLVKEDVRKELLAFESRINYQRNLATSKHDECQNTLKEIDNTKSATLNLEKKLKEVADHIEKQNVDHYQLKNASDMEKSVTQLEVLKKQKSTLEAEVFTAWENLENLQEAVPKLKTFINGINETIRELEKEYETLKGQKKSEVELNQELMLNALSLLPQSQQSTIKSLIHNQSSGKILTTVTNKQCGNCHMLIQPSVFQELDKLKSLIKCQTCGLLLIPGSL